METEEIRTLIRQKVKTQEDLANEIGISVSVLSQFLNESYTPGKHVKKSLTTWAETQINKP